MKGPDQCENCLGPGPTLPSKVRSVGLEDTLWLCAECGNHDAEDFEREQDELDEENDGTVYEFGLDRDSIGQPSGEDLSNLF